MMGDACVSDDHKLHHQKRIALCLLVLVLEL